MKQFIMMIGMPCSGKSTFISQFVHSLGLQKFVVLSTDDIIEARAKELNKTYNEIWSDEIKSATVEMNNQLKQAIMDGKDIIWDQTNLTQKSRKSKINLIPSDYSKLAFYVEASLETCLSRNVRPGKIIPENIIRNMHATIKPPELSEGFDAVFNTLIFNGRL